MRYRKIDVRMWSDERFNRLSRPQPNGQTLWQYLLTGAETCIIPGLLRIGEAGLSEALGWTLEGFREAFREVSREGMAKADWKARLVWVPKAIRYNSPQSPNVVKSWAETWDELPECDLKREAYETLKDFLKGKGKAFLEAFEEEIRKPCSNQEQEQEQEQEEAFPAHAPAVDPAPPPPPQPAASDGTERPELELTGDQVAKPRKPSWQQELWRDMRDAREGLRAGEDCVRIPDAGLPAAELNTQLKRAADQHGREWLMPAWECWVQDDANAELNPPFALQVFLTGRVLNRYVAQAKREAQESKPSEAR